MTRQELVRIVLREPSQPQADPVARKQEPRPCRRRRRRSSTWQESKTADAAPTNPGLLKVGQLVLIQKPAETFRKVGKTENWGREVHEVAGVDHGPGPVMYWVRKRGATGVMAGRLYKQQLKAITAAEAEKLS